MYEIAFEANALNYPWLTNVADPSHAAALLNVPSLVVWAGAYQVEFHEDGTMTLGSRSTPSTSSKADAASTPVPGPSRTEAESETPESGVTTAPPQSGGETADESGISPAAALQALQEYCEGRDSLPTSPPDTPASSPTTPSEPTTTNSADCSSPSGSVTIRCIELIIMADLARVASRNAKGTAETLAIISGALRKLCASTTQAQPEQGSEGEKRTSDDSEPTARR